MPLLRYNLAPTLNGMIASLPHHTTPWIVDDPTIDFAALYAEFSHFVMGRKTYETFQAMDNGDGTATASSNPLRGRPRDTVIVVSEDRDGELRRAGEVTVVGAGEVVRLIRRLKERGDGEGDIWLMGGGELAGLMLREGLLDVVEAAVMPAVVEDGVKMFGEGPGKQGDGKQAGGRGAEGWKLVLEKAEALKSGILMTRYRVVY
ncbi:hypothetical protein VTK26DRAFT_3622 [Humicola hyalothermophila]